MVFFLEKTPSFSWFKIAALYELPAKAIEFAYPANRVSRRWDQKTRLGCALFISTGGRDMYRFTLLIVDVGSSTDDFVLGMCWTFFSFSSSSGIFSIDCAGFHVCCCWYALRKGRKGVWLEI